MPIKSFKCGDTEKLFNRNPVARFANIAIVARRKLEQLDWARVLNDLRVPPGNRLEALLPANWIQTRPAACQTIESRVA